MSHAGNGCLSLRLQEQASQGMQAFALDKLVPDFGRRQHRIYLVVEDEIAHSRAAVSVSLARASITTVILSARRAS